MLVEQIVGSSVTFNTVVVLSYRQTSHVLTNECWPFMVGLARKYKAMPIGRQLIRSRFSEFTM